MTTKAEAERLKLADLLSYLNKDQKKSHEDFARGVDAMAALEATVEPEPEKLIVVEDKTKVVVEDKTKARN